MDWFLTLPPWVGESSYFIVFSLLFFCGLGLPVPEEVTFLLAGFLVEKIDGSLPLMIGIAVCGVLMGDTALFFLARRHGEKLLRIWPFRLLFSESSLERARAFFAKHGSKTVFFAGFFAGIRATTFFLSASMGISFSRFLFWDGLRTMLTCPISVWFGHEFGPYAQERLEPYKYWVLLALVGVILLLVLKEVRARRLRNTTPTHPS